MNKLNRKSHILLFFTLILIFIITGCSTNTTAQTAQKLTKSKTSTTKPEKTAGLSGEMTLSTTKGEVGTPVHFSIKGLKANTQTELQWKTVKGQYNFIGIYQFKGVPLKTRSFL